jgi:hypothetical protein
MFDMLQFGLNGVLEGLLPNCAIHKLNNWLGFWHLYVRQWGGFMLDVKHLDFMCETI